MRRAGQAPLVKSPDVSRHLNNSKDAQSAQLLHALQRSEANDGHLNRTDVPIK